jgi:acyl-CoA reductase-like NAD-dependent aldehyde dehydrogenase
MGNSRQIPSFSKTSFMPAVEYSSVTMQASQGNNKQKSLPYEAKRVTKGLPVNTLEGAVLEQMRSVSETAALPVSLGFKSDAINAANAAAAAFPAWSQTMAEARAAILMKAADLIMHRADAFVDTMAHETGGTGAWARFNCSLAADIFRHAATLANYGRECTRRGRDDDVTSYLVRQPVGVVLGIAPWNAPVVLASRAIAIPLACGNTVVLKASELCPKTHAMIIDILHDAGLPAGAANLVNNTPETAAQIVEALVGHQAVRKINFTGSTRVGRIVAEICARHLKPVVLELSGKAPLIILRDGDIDEAVKAAAFGAFFNQGQICISTERVIVDRVVADEFTDKLETKARSLTAGEPGLGEFPLGSMISTTAVDRVRALIDDAVNKGARLVAGGKTDNAVMQPTVIDNIHSSMRLYREESFGPVAAVIRSSDEDEAISIANDTPFGLASAIFSRDIDKARDLALRLETGICHINGPTVYDDPTMPFGGMKDSGYGRLGGEEAVQEFTELRWISVHHGSKDYPI